MKTFLIVLIMLAIGLGALALRKESRVGVAGHSTEVLVDGANSRVISQKDHGVTEIDLKPYAKIGFIFVSVAIIGVALALRRKKNA